MAPRTQVPDRLIPAVAAAAVTFLVLSASFGGLDPNTFPDGGLELRWSEHLRSSAEARALAATTLTFGARGLALGAVGVGLLSALLLTLAEATRRGPEAATRAALGASPLALLRWAVGRRIRRVVPWLVAGAAVGLLLGALGRATWPGRSVVPVSATMAVWAVTAPLGMIALLVGAFAIPSLTSASASNLRDGMGHGIGVLSRYPTGLRWLLPVLQLGVTGGILTASGMVGAAGRIVESSGRDDVSVIRLRLEGDDHERAAALRVAVARAERATGQDVGVATPGAFLGLGVRDYVMAECGRCYVGGLLVPFQGAEVRHHAVFPDTFRTLGIAVLEGRELTDADRAGAPRVAVVNLAFARASFHDGGPVGRRVRLGTGLGSWYDVVGVVEGAALGSALGTENGPAVFVSALQHPPEELDLFLREGPPFIADLPEAEPLAAYLVRHAAPLVWAGRAALGLGSAALILAVAGVWAVMAFVARRRRRELALRVALGASPRNVTRRLLGEGARVVLLGLVVGLWAGTVVLAVGTGLADGLEAGYIPAAVSVAAVLGLAGLTGCLGVARSAARREPREILAGGR